MIGQWRRQKTQKLQLFGVSIQHRRFFLNSQLLYSQGCEYCIVVDRHGFNADPDPKFFCECRSTSAVSDHTQPLHILDYKTFFWLLLTEVPALSYLSCQHHRFHNFWIFWTVYWNFLEKIEFRVTFGLNGRGSESASSAGCGSGKKKIMRSDLIHNIGK